MICVLKMRKNSSVENDTDKFKISKMFSHLNRLFLKSISFTFLFCYKIYVYIKLKI